MKISLIVAAAGNGVIGRDGEMPWRLAADLRRFKALTMGHHLLVGRKTWEAIGRPLPGRKMLVVTRRDMDLGAEAELGSVSAASSPEVGVERARVAGETELFVAGGGEIYRALLPRADRLYFTRVHGEIEGDTYFPGLDLAGWQLVEREELPADAKNTHPTTFAIYDRPATRPAG